MATHAYKSQYPGPPFSGEFSVQGHSNLHNLVNLNDMVNTDKEEEEGREGGREKNSFIMTFLLEWCVCACVCACMHIGM